MEEKKICLGMHGAVMFEGSRGLGEICGVQSLK
jgi:hypothetical protein